MSKHILQLSLDIETDADYRYDELMVAIDKVSNDLYRDGFNVLGFDVSDMDEVYNTFTDDSFNIIEKRNRQKRIKESEDYGFNGKGAKTIKVAPAYARNGNQTYYTVQSEIDRLHDDHSERIWCTDSKGNIRDGRVESGWTFSIDMIDPTWLKKHGFELNENRNRIIEKSYSTNGARYEIICYYGPDFRGYKMSDETDSYDELKELAWDYINNGCVEIIDNETGKSVRYTDEDEIYYEGEINLGI